jgi:hypothetical protein
MANAPVSDRLTYEVALPQKQKRMRELIIYISDRSADDPKYGATKLNKILWWADFIAFKQRGKPITGEQYQRLPQGPCPVRLKPLRDTMIRDSEIVIRHQRVGVRTQHRIVPLRDADLTIFDGEDIAIVDAVIASLRDHGAVDVSVASHGRAWNTRNDYDLIPYEAAFLSDEGVTPSDLARTEALAKELGWDVGRRAA